MSLPDAVIETSIGGVDLVTTPTGLASIKDPGCAAAIWRRPMVANFQNWLDGLDPQSLPRARVVMRPEVVGKAITQLVDATTLPACEERAMLVEDIARLAGIFARLMDAPYLRVRLDVVATNACRKFHIDAVTARLVCTYRGTVVSTIDAIGNTGVQIIRLLKG